MLIRFWTGLAKVTGWPAQKLCFRTRILYEDATVQKRRIRGPAILISNHTSFFDFAVYLFVFFSRTLRFQMAEVLFQKKLQGWLLKRLGGVYVNRGAHDFGFIAQSEEILRKGGVVGIFPESRLPKPGEERPLAFKTSAAFLALNAGVPVIPVYTNGSYFRKERAVVMIGTPMDVRALTDASLSDRENINRVTQAMRDRIIELEAKAQKRLSEKRAPLFSPRYLFFDFVRLTASLPGLVAFRPKLLYVSRRARQRLRGGVLVISNHNGYRDPVDLLFCFWYRRQRFICMKNFFEGKAGWLFKGFLCIPIDRENFSLDSFRQITGHLQAGEVVTMFPEGHVAAGSGELAAFKSGMVLMALKSGRPIVPVYIRKREHVWNRLTMVIGEPVDVAAPYGDKPTFAQMAALAKLLEDKENALKDYDDCHCMKEELSC